MAKPVFIERTPPSAFDYASLREQFISRVQQLAGAYWTDYNEHDPGVTTLEQLCYVLTEIAYRADFPVEDFLARSEQCFIDGKMQGLFTPDEIFSSGAITLADYRKILLDALPGLSNVWIEVLPAAPASGLRGLYQLLIAPSEEQGETTVAQLVEKAAQVFHAHRSLCEDLHRVIVLKPREVRLQAKLEVNEERDIESVVAEVLFRVGAFLCDVPGFYSLEELQQEGKGYETIFEGPLLSGGFIKNQELQPLRTHIKMNDLIPVIMAVKGITGVIEVGLQTEGRTEMTELRLLPEEFFRLLNDQMSELIVVRKRQTVYRFREELAAKKPGNFAFRVSGLIALKEKNFPCPRAVIVHWKAITQYNISSRKITASGRADYLLPPLLRSAHRLNSLKAT